MSLAVWGVLLALILANAVFVAAEFAAVGVAKSRVRQRAEEGDVLARRLEPVLTDPRRLDQYIAASQVGITVASLLLGVVGETSLAPLLGGFLESRLAMPAEQARATASVVALVSLTVAQMVLGELVPKSLALQYTTRTALWTVVPMQWSLGLLRRPIALLNGSGNAVLHLFGFREAANQHVHSPREIELLLAESQEGGLIEAHEHRRLRQALNLGARTAREMMVPRDSIRALDLQSATADVVSAVTESPFTRLPVFHGTIDRIVGLVHTRDVAVSLPVAGGKLDLRSLVRPVLFVPAELPADRLLARLRDARRQMAVVCDEYGSTLGIVSIDDILDAVLGDMADDLKDAVAREVPVG